MRYLFTISIILFAVIISSAQRQEFLPTIDIGLNGGVSFAKFSTYRGQLKMGGFSLMANTGYNRHILELELGNSLNDAGLKDDLIFMDIETSVKPSIFNFNYTFARELFAYYPACMIRNQLLAGLRLNAEVFMGDTEVTGNSLQNYLANDYGRYSVDLTLITDYHLNKSNYLVLQLYAPILTYFALPLVLEPNANRPYEFDDRIDISKNYFFKDGELGWIKQHSKLGINATYRLLLAKNVALQLKYNGRLNSHSKINMVNNIPLEVDVEENYHQITLGIVGHIIRPPIGF